MGAPCARLSLTQRQAFLHSAAVATDEERGVERRVGTTLCGKWTLERLLGVGGMAAVYVAEHKIGRKEAIKILQAQGILYVTPNRGARVRQLSGGGQNPTLGRPATVRPFPIAKVDKPIP